MPDDHTTHAAIDERRDDESPRAYVALVEGAGSAPRVVKLPRGETISIGRAHSSGLLLDDAAVSRLHATLTWSGGSVVELTDCESRNGVTVGGVKITGTVPVTSGTELGIGITRLVVFISDESGDKKQSDAHGASSVLIARDAAMVRTVALMERAARTDATVLLVGETGSGKELLATRVHALSTRRDGPFVTVNCGAIAETLAESMLFGHEKGSFTGADKQHTGVFEQAHGGTLLLDEVGELSGAMQVRLLRVLQERELVRVGSTKPITVDVRLVAATNSDLEAKTQEGSFREDLLYRLDVMRIAVPPLRKRPDDILPLARRFVEELGAGKPIELTQTALEALRAHRWPGNVRELRNVIERSIALSEGHQLDVGDLDGLSSEGPSRKGTLKVHVGDAEKDAIVEALEACDGNQTHAAKRLGISRRSLIYKMERYGLKRPPSRRGRS